jgi:hypothetical protein
MKRIIDNLEERQRILKQLHDENDHRDKEDIYKRIINRYWWNDLYNDDAFIKKDWDEHRLHIVK